LYYRYIFREMLIPIFLGLLLSSVYLIGYLWYFGIYIDIPLYGIPGIIELTLYPILLLICGSRSGSPKRGILSGFSMSSSKIVGKTVIHTVLHGVEEEYLIHFPKNLLFSSAGLQLNYSMNIFGLLNMLLFRFLTPVDLAIAIFISAFAGYLKYLGRLKQPLKKYGSGNNKILVLRDYWSNRQRFGKNLYPEDPKIDLSKMEDKYKSLSELYLVDKGLHVDVYNRNGAMMASNVLNPKNLVSFFEPIWNPLPLAFERKLHKYFYPISVLLFTSILTIIFFNSFFILNDIWASMGTFSIYNPLSQLFINMFLRIVFIPLIVAGLLLGILLRIRYLNKIKPESSLSLLWFLILSPITLFAVSYIPYANMILMDFQLVQFLSILLSIIVFIYILSALRIRAFENITVFLYHNDENILKTFRYSVDRPRWLNNDYYWVIRYMYFWPVEITFPLPHIDWERLELWVNARTGKLEWVVTDYHYRELWYEINGKVDRLLVDFDPNFHTPMPITIGDEYSFIQNFLANNIDLKNFIKSQLKLIVKGKWMNLWIGTIFESPIREYYRNLHRAEKIMEIVGSRLLSSRLAALHWKNWRYPLGTDRKEIYSINGRNHPATPGDIILIE